MVVIVSQIWGKILPWVRVSQWMKSTQNAETFQAVINALELITREVAVIHNHIHSKEEKIQSLRKDILFVKINQEPVVVHCVNVTRNFLKIYLKLSGIGNHSITKTGVVLITKPFA